MKRIFLEDVAIDALNLIDAHPNKEENPELHRLFTAYMYLYTLVLEKGIVRDVEKEINNVTLH
tara:strand:+ start:259 stop:447 length:189 start_codon:yes stop_codon:yes gene_type:complete